MAHTQNHTKSVCRRIHKVKPTDKCSYCSTISYNNNLRPRVQWNYQWLTQPLRYNGYCPSALTVTLGWQVWMLACHTQQFEAFSLLTVSGQVWLLQKCSNWLVVLHNENDKCCGNEMFRCLLTPMHTVSVQLGNNLIKSLWTTPQFARVHVPYICMVFAIKSIPSHQRQLNTLLMQSIKGERKGYRY